MNLLYLSRSIIPSRHANSVHIMKMCQAFSQNGHQVHLLAVQGDSKANPYQYYGVTDGFKLSQMKRLKIKGIGSLLYSLAMVLKIKKMNPKPDLIYSRDILSLLGASNLAPFCYESHHMPQKSFQKLLFKALISQRNFKKLIVITESLKQDYLQAYPALKDSNIVVAHDGADPVAELHLIDVESLANRQTYNIGYIGQLYPGRGADIVIELARQIPEHQFQIIGGYEKDIQYWKDQSSDLKNVHFHGYVSNGELGPYYENLDILLAPYHQAIYTGNKAMEISRWISPMKVFEYMAHGKPMLVSDLPVIREVLQNEKNAILCQPENIEDWSTKLRWLISNPQLQCKISQQALNDLISKHTWLARAAYILREISEK